jgi:hypothetical protein
MASLPPLSPEPRDSLEEETKRPEIHRIRPRYIGHIPCRQGLPDQILVDDHTRDCGNRKVSNVLGSFEALRVAELLEMENVAGMASEGVSKSREGGPKFSIVLIADDDGGNNEMAIGTARNSSVARLVHVDAVKHVIRLREFPAPVQIQKKDGPGPPSAAYSSGCCL